MPTRAAIVDALMQLSDEEARSRVEYLLEDVRRLRETVSAVAGRGLGLLVSIS